MLIDTDVLIWYMRGNPKARKAIEKQQSLAISVVTYMELLQGMRNKQELRELQRWFRQWEMEIIQVGEQISSKAMFYTERYCLSHAMHLADALVVATAASTGLSLLTANTRHYSCVGEVDVVRFRP